ncbi:hypothetical protein GCM10009641_26200 [Mycobacterium cookii]|uniref:Uncharacterized protein n=1 Tax=Mycobacterium cookii TaxID=1775 RepID=A0A7I7KTJ8_9MYCO|nr:hypothetical protein [Mycobacterium cookii]MCV7331255.1 hypothetical protein [Mycobacterium cookii]BBX44788.1 hypothetical protein MCOO_08030 [Mycobacterium cookii]
MATYAEPATSVPGASSPYRTDYTTWKILAWTGPVFLAAFFCLWGLLAHNIPPFPPSATPEEVMAHYKDLRLPIMIGMSVCLTMTAFYMSWSVAIARVMERVEGPGNLLSKLEMMGGTITCAPVMTACAFWLTAAHEVNNLTPGILHMLYWMGWLLIDLAYFVTSLQIAAVSIVFMRDKREKKLVPEPVIWWGWVTFASFFVVSAIPFVTTGPLAFNGVISFWIAFFTWFFWIPSLSYFIIKAVDRIKAEDEAAGRVNA